MNRLQYDAEKEVDILPCDYFHLMAGTELGGLIIVLLVALWLSVDEVIRELAEILHTVHLPEDLTPSIRTDRLKTVIATLLERHGILEVSLLQDS